MDEQEQTLVNMGFPLAKVKAALVMCNNNVAQAIDFLVANPIGEDVVPIVEEKIDIDQILANHPKAGDFKMVLLVRDDLGMGKGKIAAQCCHAALGVYRDILSSGTAQQKKWLNTWETEAEAKVALKVKDEQELMQLYRKAKSIGLPACYIIDAGRTQIAAGSKTVCSVGPAPVPIIDLVTKQLKLL